MESSRNLENRVAGSEKGSNSLGSLFYIGMPFGLVFIQQDHHLWQRRHHSKPSNTVAATPKQCIGTHAYKQVASLEYSESSSDCWRRQHDCWHYDFHEREGVNNGGSVTQSAVPFILLSRPELLQQMFLMTVFTKPRSY